MSPDHFQTYVDRGWVLVPYWGNHVNRPGGKEPKHPAASGYTSPDFKGLTPEEASRWNAQGGWVAVRVPQGTVVLDMDNPESRAWTEAYLTRPDRGPVQRTRNGFHVWFRDCGCYSGNSKTMAGIGELTPRLAGKNCVLVEPSEGKTWIEGGDFENLPEVPPELRPVKEANAPGGSGSKALKKIARKIKRLDPSTVNGNDFDLAFIGWACRTPATDEEIHEALKIIWENQYSIGRVQTVIEATRLDLKAGGNVSGWPSLVELFPSLEDKRPRVSKEDEALEVARKIDAATGGEIACFNPPETPRATPTFSRKQEDDSFRDMAPKEVQDQWNEAAGRPLSPSEFTLVSWYLATAVLRNRGTATLQTGLACKNGLITFDPPGFVPGRPDRPCQFTVPREFFPEWDSLPDPLSLEIIQGWKPWGQDPLFLLEVVARVLLTQPAGDFLACFGPGGDGKSTFFEFIEVLIGPWNVCRPNPYEFSKERRNRGIAELRGKLLCLLDDAGEDTFVAMGTFLKEQPTAPTLQGARLYEDPISFPNTATLAILGNRLPKRTDHSRGFFDRYNLSIWPNRIRFTPGDVADIEKKWAENAREMDLIFSYGVHLAWHFVASGRWYRFNDRQESEALSDCLARAEARFLWERFDREPGGFLPWGAIEEEWKLWWPDYNNRDRFDRDRFLEALSATWQGEEVRKQIDRERYRGVEGLRIVPKTRNNSEMEKPSIDSVFRKQTDGTENKVARKTHIFSLLFNEENGKKEKEKSIEKSAPGNMGQSGHITESPQYTGFMKHCHGPVYVAGRDEEF